MQAEFRGAPTPPERASVAADRRRSRLLLLRAKTMVIDGGRGEWTSCGSVLQPLRLIYFGLDCHQRAMISRQGDADPPPARPIPACRASRQPPSHQLRVESRRPCPKLVSAPNMLLALLLSLPLASLRHVAALLCSALLCSAVPSSPPSLGLWALGSGLWALSLPWPSCCPTEATIRLELVGHSKLLHADVTHVGNTELKR
ncbi:uncharacterized protein SETTUDRAFT_157255 [Exserohilum turcica Et28A]|uniref:Uncharacterized protein n=1 Tax=Exserohilum turcicum (strain 28A) TaxID=671987 RepID=R0JYJ3_EXST2|nr:uncharacterized protein SETTUDRAFT_157255 [Exserohilum turcica Et28A]EOA81307.1 hypothetical protein SETTUDRAFT_157255 [Exserohilum turcica Et28A]